MIELNKIYNCDCRDLMKEIIVGGEQVDCIITDPPYLMQYATNYRKDKQCKFSSVIIGDNDENLIKEYIKLCYDILKDNSAFYCFCSSSKIDIFKQEIEKYFTIKNIIVWVKNNWTAGDLKAQLAKQYEFCIYANKGRKLFCRGKRLSDVWFFDRVSSDKLIHQNQKPIPLIEQMIELSTNKGDIVFDGFMGSCTTAVACHRLGRKFIGCELDKEYYEIGVRRLEQEKNQINLFEMLDE